MHRGTLTTQSLVKKLNREAEAFATFSVLRGEEYPAAKLDRLWKTLLLNQFHDILPGSSITEVYEDAHEQLRAVVDGATELRDAALSSVTGGEGEAVLVANAGLAPRMLTILLRDADFGPIAGVTDAEGDVLNVQRTDEGLLVHDPDRRVPGLGGVEIQPGERSEYTEPRSRVQAARSGDATILENDSLRVEIGADGTLHRVHDREAEREVLAGRGNQLWAYVDKPTNWDAWDIDADYELEGEEVSAVERIEVVEEGPLRAAVRVERGWRNSRIVQTYRLLAGSRRLDVKTEIDWREREVLLRSIFPLNVRSHEATFETMYGAQRRPTHTNTSWDAARFEVSAHRFADISEPGYGVALLNDGKYGHSARDNVLGLSLLRSPLYPDPFADEGRHSFTYSLFPHPGDWTEADVVDEAFALNSPLFAGRAAGRTASNEFGFVAVEGAKLALGALKMVEDGSDVILRLYEPHGARGSAVLRFAAEVENIERANLLEETEGGVLPVEDGVLRLEVSPFEVVTLRIGLCSG